MSSADFVAKLLLGFEAAAADLGTEISAYGAPITVLYDLGWAVPPGTDKTAVQPQFDPLSAALNQLSGAAQTLSQLVSGSDLEALLSAIGDVTAAIGATVNAVRALDHVQPDGLPPPFSDQDLWTSLAEETVDLLLIRYLDRNQQMVSAGLRLLGVVVEQPQPATGNRDAYLQQSLDWSALGSALSAPRSLPSSVYGWGGNFDEDSFVRNLVALFDAFGLAPARTHPPTSLLDIYYAPDNPSRSQVTQLGVPFYWEVSSSDPEAEALDADVELGLLPVPLTTDLGGAPAGIVLYPLLQGAVTTTVPLSDSVSLTIAGGLSAAIVRVNIYPAGTSIVIDPPAAQFDGSVRADAQPQTPWILLGTPDSMRAELHSGHAGFSVNASAAGIQATIEVAIDSGLTVIEFGEGDGFITSVIGSDPHEIPFSVSALWSSTTGFRFGGQATLDNSIPLHLSLAGAISIDTLYLSLGGGADGSATVTLAVAASAMLGPIAVSVDRVGLTLVIEPRPSPQPPGNLGPLELQFAFKAPDGLGLALDAGVATGGGYIQCDAAKGQYAGILELALESLSLTAIGLIQTKNADGSPLPGGFSLLVIISVEFLPPVELGFGFSLNGVGGLFGWARTICADALRAGVRSGSLSDIMFPADPVGHAPQLIQALSGFFPVAPGRLLIGPFVQIQWGSPLPILTADLGVMIELPAPIRVAVMGVLSVGLPQADAEAVVQLNLDALGLIDFGTGELSLDASLYQSKIAEFAISGDMALRFGWKPATREFVLSLGGFFPSFATPPGFPTLKRLTLSLSSGDNPTFTLQAYLAVTSNTVQFGAQAQLAVTAGSASLAGMLSFDALIHLNPFGLQVNFAAALTVKVDGNELLGVTVNGQLSGPDPWLISGQATVKVLFISASVNFSAQLGSGTPPPPPAPVQVIDLLGADLGNPACWSALPPAGETAVTVTPPPAGAPQLYAHPLGSLTFHQRTTPLGLTLQKYGAAAVAGPAKLGIISVAYGNAVLAPAALTAVDDAFAPGQYLALSDSDALSQPAFATYQAGVAFTPAAPDYDQLAAGEATAVGYAVDLIDSHGEPPTTATVTLGTQATGRLVTTGAPARAPARTTGPRRYQGTPGDIAVRSGAPGGPVVR